MENVAITPQEWPAISLEKGLQIIYQQYRYTVLFNTSHGTMICVGNTKSELVADIKRGKQYCDQNNIIIKTYSGNIPQIIGESL